MRVRKTNWSQRNTYRYEVQFEAAPDRYHSRYIVITAGADGVTEELIKLLHRMDDNEVENNLRNARPPLSVSQVAEKAAWEAEHPGERYPRNWCLSLEYVAWEDSDGDEDKGRIQAELAVESFEDVPDDIARLREIVATLLTPRQRQAYQLIGLDGYSATDAAKVMGVSINVANIHYHKAIERIRKNF